MIALYHRVSPRPDPAYPPLPPAQFEAHVDVLRRAFSIISLAEMIERHRHEKSLAGCCAITFDDGYADFAEHAYPILARHGLPATHFLVLESVRGGRPNWNWRANRLLHAARARGQDLAQVPEPFQVLGGLDELGIADHLGSWEAARRQEWIGQAEALLAPFPALLEEEPAMLRPSDLPRFDASLISWGSHTVSHAMLGRCGSSLRFELEHSRRELSEAVGRDVRLLSYPNSSHSIEARQAAREAGYDAALAVEQREVSARCDLMALPRFDVGWMSARRLRLELSGAIQAMRNKRR